MPHYFVTDPAAADLTDLWQGRLERGGSEANADRLIDGLLESFQTLADFPDVGTSRDYLPIGIFAFPHDRHMIFYRKVDYGIDIVHVKFGKMDLAGYFADDPDD